MAASHRRPSRRLLYLPFAIAGVIVAGYGLLWRHGATEMRRAVVSWADDQRENGLDVSYQKISTGGFPFFLRAKIDGVEIGDPDRWRWQVDRLAIDALPYDLNRLIFSPLGEQRFDHYDAGVWFAQAENIRASITRDPEREWLFMLEVTNGAARAEGKSSKATVSRLLVNIAPNVEDPALIESSVHAVDILLEDGRHSGFVSLLDATFGLEKAAVFTDAGDPAENWTRANGALVVHHLGMEAEGARLTAAGTLGLDVNGYPAGVIEAKIENPASVATILAGAGILNKYESEAMATGLGFMALATGGTLAVPIKFHDGMAKIGKIKIADLPKIE